MSQVFKSCKKKGDKKLANCKAQICIKRQKPFKHEHVKAKKYAKLANTVNFQNNAQVQINAWFKLTPGTKHMFTIYNTVFCISKERLVQFNAWSDAI